MPGTVWKPDKWEVNLRILKCMEYNITLLSTHLCVACKVVYEVLPPRSHPGLEPSHVRDNNFQLALASFQECTT